MTLSRISVYALAALGALYLAVFVLLLVFQRDMLFIGAGHPAGPPPPDYRAHMIAVPGGGRVLTWSIAANAGAPTFVFFTGNGSPISDFADTGEQFHRRGWGVVLASYRGYSGNSGNPSEAGLMQDARAVIAALPRGGKLILWGHSLGSGVAARMAAEHRCDGLVLESAFTSVADVAARRFPIFPVRWFIRDPFETEALLSKIAVPVLIFHGTDDAMVPFDMGRTLAARLGRQARFVPVAGVGHIPHETDLAPVVADWLQHNALAGRR